MLEGKQSCVAREAFGGLGISGIEMIKENRNRNNVSSNRQGFRTFAQKPAHTFRYLCSGCQGGSQRSQFSTVVLRSTIYHTDTRCITSHQAVASTS